MWMLADFNIITKDKQGWIALAVAGIAITWILFRPRFKKKDPLDAPAFSSLAQQRTVERQMQNLLVELSEMARQISAQLDTRAAKLEFLIKEADEKIATLKSLSNGTPPPATAITSSIVERAASDDLTLIPIDPRHAQVYELADKGHGTNEIARQLGQNSGEIELILALRPRP
jgi:hypothetical protein